MENQNPNAGQNLNDLKNLFSDIKKKQTQTKRKSREDILSKYFVPRKTKETFRILPPKRGRKHIEEAYFHVVTTNIAGGKKKHGSIIYCPAHNDPKIQKLDSQGNPLFDSNNQPVMIPSPCPLCAKGKALLAKQDPSIKFIKKENLDENQKRIKEKNDGIYKEAIKWEAKKFFIIRGIDKGAEKDGVKFWRFKFNFKNQGTLDKLMPILEDFVAINQVDFADKDKGTDLSITMTDSEFNKIIYKSISAISAKGQSPLHSDPLIAQQWLEDDITWRDVFKPKQAPNITPYEFLVMLTEGNNPYWDDSDSSNKHWVFPNRPDLEELANTRNRDLEADEEEFEQASDLVDNEDYGKYVESSVTINNINPSNVGTYNDDASDIGKEAIAETAPVVTTSTPNTTLDTSAGGENYDDLPF